MQDRPGSHSPSEHDGARKIGENEDKCVEDK